jgi:hypothetical protein
LHRLWASFKKTAILEEELLDAIWKKRRRKEFPKTNKDMLSMFLQRHMILAKLNDMDTEDKCVTLFYLAFCIDNTALLTNLFEKVTADA